MKRTIKRNQIIGGLVIFLIIGFLVYYNIFGPKRRNNSSFNYSNMMDFKKNERTANKNLRKPNIWLEDFFGGSKKSGGNPSDIKR